MPITRIPIIHKFGIISQSQREELQDRLLQQSYLQSVKTQRLPQTARNPLELSESFVQQFNGATSLDEKERLEGLAYKILNRTKKRAGISEGGRGKNVDIPKAWSELSMLAQCRGKIQEECLDLLIVSLNQAPLATNHIASLFYLAETTLYWLRTDAMDQPFLRIGEIKLLKMGQGVFLRLYYHNMAGHLKGYKECKNRLITYLTGVRECEEAYSPYPGAHLCLRFISEVGRLVVEDILTEDLNTPHATPLDKPQGTAEGMPSLTEPDGHSEFDNISSHRHDQILEEDEDLLSPTPSPKLPMMSPVETPIPTSNNEVKPRTHTGFQSSIHDLSPTLWHSLDVWRCVVHLSSGFREAVRALSMCGSTLSTEHWVDAMCALRVIAETAKSDLKVLKTLQNLARGVLPSTTPMPPSASPMNHSREEMEQSKDEDDAESKSEENELESIVSGMSQTSLSDFYSADFKLGDDSVHRSGRKGNRLTLQSDFVTDGKHLSDLSGGSLLKSTRDTSTCVFIDTPQEKHAELLTSPSSFGQKVSQGSTPSTLPNFSSARDSLNSAGDIPLPSGLDVPSGSIEDSDLEPGEDSEVDANEDDVTKLASSLPPEFSRTLPDGIRLKREVSFDIEPTDRFEEDGELPKKSNLRGGSGRSEGTRKSNSAKSVTIDPVPNMAYYSKASGNISNKQTAKTSGASELAANHLFEAQGLSGWPWEVSFTYAELMSYLCLHGSTAEIQRTALVGSKKKGYGPYMSKKHPGTRTGRDDDEEWYNLVSAGLLDLTEYQGKIDGDEIKESAHWGWRVRYAAILGLIKVTRCASTEKLQEGMRTVAWNAVMRCHSKEKDQRVLEAFRVGQVEAHIETQMQKALISRSFNSRLAAGLAEAYLPPLAPPIEVAKKSPRRKVELPKPKQPLKTGPNRLSLKNEILLATALDEPTVDFNTRTSLDLQRIVEDQWRKEIQQKLEEEEKEKEKELEDEQKMEEARQKERSQEKARKFTRGGSGSPMGTKSPTRPTSS